MPKLHPNIRYQRAILRVLKCQSLQLLGIIIVFWLGSSVLNIPKHALQSSVLGACLAFFLHALSIIVAHKSMHQKTILRYQRFVQDLSLALLVKWCLMMVLFVLAFKSPNTHAPMFLAGFISMYLFALMSFARLNI